MVNRKIGRSDIAVSGLGLGCWAIGGPYTSDGKPVGWGEVDDAESIRAIHRGIELGVTLFDTAACYGAGHSERILGQALQGRRDEVVIATKFGHLFDESKKEALGADSTARQLQASTEASLKRLGTDRIDLMQFHLGGHDPEAVDELLDALEQLVASGKIRCYGWSTDDPNRAAKFATGKHCAAVQQQLNILEGNLDTLALAERENLASLNRGPLAKAVLTGKFNRGDQLPSNDVRHRWDTTSGPLAEAITVVDRLKPILTANGHTLTQAAIAWLWAKSGVTLPIPGFKTVKQVEENAGALRLGPLTAEQMTAIDEQLAVAGWERQRFA